jgi:hypothetical protein
VRFGDSNFPGFHVSLPLSNQPNRPRSVAGLLGSVLQCDVIDRRIATMANNPQYAQIPALREQTEACNTDYDKLITTI